MASESVNYDAQIEKIKNTPNHLLANVIYYEWQDCLGLFQSRPVGDNRNLCFTEMKSAKHNKYVSQEIKDHPVFKAMYEDALIPDNPDAITLDSLERFKFHAEAFDNAGIF